MNYFIEFLNHSIHGFQQSYSAGHDKLKILEQSVWSLKFAVTHITLIINLWLSVSGIICQWHIIVALRIIESANLI